MSKSSFQSNLHTIPKDNAHARIDKQADLFVKTERRTKSRPLGNAQGRTCLQLTNIPPHAGEIRGKRERKGTARLVVSSTRRNGLKHLSRRRTNPKLGAKPKTRSRDIAGIANKKDTKRRVLITVNRLQRIYRTTGYLKTSTPLRLSRGYEHEQKCEQTKQLSHISKDNQLNTKRIPVHLPFHRTDAKVSIAIISYVEN